MSRASRIAFTCLLLPLLGASVTQAQGTCDRACLRALLEGYLDAVVDNDPGSAALAVGVRETENAINFAPGRGVWQTVTALGEVSGQAAYFGTKAPTPRSSACASGSKTASSRKPSGMSQERTIRGSTGRVSPAGRPRISTIPNTSRRTRRRSESFRPTSAPTATHSCGSR